jgi:hypothetical protein
MAPGMIRPVGLSLATPLTPSLFAQQARLAVSNSFDRQADFMIMKAEKTAGLIASGNAVRQS